jgi:catechol 2,3-dioxygenase-like lactoylglutathione lyase family enzyme
VLDHASITVTDMARAGRFYDACLGALGVPRVGASDAWIGYGARCDAARPDLSYLSIRSGP